jgi:CRP/FNR family cyclic AMP-dependent transcriptional regulator
MKTEHTAALRGTALFGSLINEELADIAERAVKLHFRKGEMLFIAGEQASGIFVVLSGAIRVFQHNAQGHEQVVLVAGAGAVISDIPVFDDGPYPASAMSELDTDVLFIAKRDVHDFVVSYPQMALSALRSMSSRVRSQAQLVRSLSFHDVEHRLASFLVAEVQHTGCSAQGQIVFQPPLSNQEIAGRIGSVRDVVSRVFAQLKRDGLITTRGRSIIIEDIDALKQYAASATKMHSPRHQASDPMRTSGY